MAVRQLSAIYLAAVSGFGIAVAFAHHPDWKIATATTISFAGRNLAVGADTLNARVVQPAFRYATREAVTLYRQATTSTTPSPRIAQVAQPHFEQRFLKGTSPPPELRLHEAPTLRPSLSEGGAGLAAIRPAQPKPRMRAQTIAPATGGNPPSLAPIAPMSGAEIARIEQRLHDSLTSEMLVNFELFLYVSKASDGPWAQHMYVFEKQATGDLRLLYNWPVSTGREKIEFNARGRRLPSFTPEGYYELDPNRMYVDHVSGQWQTPMPYAMFFNWIRRGKETGLAIHAATGEDVNLLGSRASAGCVRLSPENARVLFALIREKYKGLMPKFAFDRRTATMAKDGMLLHEPDGSVQLTDGYKVLVFIEDFGGENVVAALY